MSDDEHNFDQGATAGESITHSALASDVKKGGHLIMNGRPCKIVELSNRQGKLHIVGIDIFTGRKQELSVEPDADVDIPTVHRNEYQLLYTEDGFLHLLAPDGSEKTDVRVPEGETGSKITEYEESGEEAIITVISSLGEELAIGVKRT